MILAVTSEPVDWAFAATVALVLGAGVARRSRAIRRDPWREAVLTERARAHGAHVRAHRAHRTPVVPPRVES